MALLIPGAHQSGGDSVYIGSRLLQIPHFDYCNCLLPSFSLPTMPRGHPAPSGHGNSPFESVTPASAYPPALSWAQPCSCRSLLPFLQHLQPSRSPPSLAHAPIPVSAPPPMLGPEAASKLCATNPLPCQLLKQLLETHETCWQDQPPSLCCPVVTHCTHTDCKLFRAGNSLAFGECISSAAQLLQVYINKALEPQ